MSELIELMRCKTNFYAEKGASMTEIERAEKSLGAKFAADFKEYLQGFGAVSYDGHELTGFSSDKNLCVVGATQKNWRKHNVTQNLYVIEETHIDGIVIWQDGIGHVYQSSPSCLPVKITDSLLEYIRL